jgi:predicted dehydrogenase
MAGREVRRIGLIGMGKHGTRYARHVRDEAPALELAAIARRDADKAAAAAREYGARAYADYRALIDDGGVDAVVAVVPPALNVDIVARAARAGIPVLLEKPAATSMTAGRAMLTALAENPTPVMVAQTLRYNGVVRALAAARDAIGPLRSLTFTQRFEPSRLEWIDDPQQAGGIVLQTGVHAFDLMRVLSGLEAESVTCQTHMVHTQRTEDNFVATVRLQGGAALATVSCARTSGARNGHIELSGEGGTLIGDHVLNRAYRVSGTTMQPLPVAEAVPTVREVLRDFVTALRSGAPMPITLADGLRAVAVADACYAAARTGQVATVAAVEDLPDAARGAA